MRICDYCGGRVSVLETAVKTTVADRTIITDWVAELCYDCRRTLSEAIAHALRTLPKKEPSR